MEGIRLLKCVVNQTDLIWIVLEAGLIDFSGHTRLSVCLPNCNSSVLKARCQIKDEFGQTGTFKLMKWANAAK